MPARHVCDDDGRVDVVRAHDPHTQERAERRGERRLKTLREEGLFRHGQQMNLRSVWIERRERDEIEGVTHRGRMHTRLERTRRLFDLRVDFTGRQRAGGLQRRKDNDRRGRNDRRRSRGHGLLRHNRRRG